MLSGSSCPRACVYLYVCVCEEGPAAGHLLATCIGIAAVVIALSLLSQQRQPTSVRPHFFRVSLHVCVTPSCKCVCICERVENMEVGASWVSYTCRPKWMPR